MTDRLRGIKKLDEVLVLELFGFSSLVCVNHEIGTVKDPKPQPSGEVTDVSSSIYGFSQREALCPIITYTVFFAGCQRTNLDKECHTPSRTGIRYSSSPLDRIVTSNRSLMSRLLKTIHFYIYISHTMTDIIHAKLLKFPTCSQ